MSRSPYITQIDTRAPAYNSSTKSLDRCSVRLSVPDEFKWIAAKLASKNSYEYNKIIMFLTIGEELKLRPPVMKDILSKDNNQRFNFPSNSYIESTTKRIYITNIPYHLSTDVVHLSLIYDVDKSELLLMSFWTPQEGSIKLETEQSNLDFLKIKKGKYSSLEQIKAFRKEYKC
jgi:hypothetical protein